MRHGPRIGIALALLAVLCLTVPRAPAQEGAASMILVNGKVVTLDSKSTIADALAVRGDAIVAVGGNEAVRQLAGPHTRVVDLAGRMVIPGLIDSHIHAIRSGLTFGVETDWSDVTSIAEGLQRIAASARRRPGAWIIVPGGWHEGQLAERRGPTPAELAQAAPDNPVYVQHLYDYAVINARGMAMLGLDGDAKVPPNGKLDLDADNRPSGIVRGDLPTFSRLFARVAAVDFAGQVAGTRAFFNQLASVGITGVIDAAGGGMFARHYYPLFQVWRDGNLPIRVAYFLNSQNSGQEAKELKDFFQLMPAQFGDDRLKVLGVGEVVVWGMHDGPAGRVKAFTPKPGAADALREIAAWAAERRIAIQIHASTDSAAGQILDIFEAVNAKTPIGALRWSIAHVENASKETLARMQRLGMIWAVQDRLYFEGDVWPRRMGNDAARTAPPIADGLAAGLVVAGGTDGPRSAPYNPFVTLEWLVSGRSVTGSSYRSKEQSPSREQALRIHTVNSAYMAFDEGRRGTLEAGKWADLVVLSDDYFSVPQERISKLKALLTLVGGQVRHAAAPFSSLAAAAAR
ncbi:MAG: amidohydrolase [Proteobacteria bacterium]|nr:amidohydrolase [Pseudomonadota bacterium]